MFKLKIFDLTYMLERTKIFLNNFDFQLGTKKSVMFCFVTNLKYFRKKFKVKKRMQSFVNYQVNAPGEKVGVFN